MKTFKMPDMNDREVAIVLSALRAAQKEREPLDVRFADHFEGMEQDGSVTDTEIDDLCEKINCG